MGVNDGVNDPIVIDIGSEFVSAGFAGYDRPTSIIPAVVGSPRSALMGQKETYVGTEALSRRGLCSLSYPVRRGAVANWVDFEWILRHAFYNELRLAPEEHSILLTDATLDSRASRERLTHLLFENLGVPAMNIIQASVLDLLFTGTSTGVAVHLEGGLTNVVAVKDGHPLPGASYSFDVGGSDLTDYMRILLVDRGYELSNLTYEEIIPQIKESLCYVALDYSDELSKVSRRYDFEKTYELPDGQVISLFEELFQVPEVLFKPSLISREYPGIHYAAYNAIMRCDASIQEALFSNIVLAGPDSLYPGIAERLESELKAIAPPSTVINVVADPQRRYASWLGGSMLANSNSSNGDWWMSREEYKTHGPQLIHSKY